MPSTLWRKLAKPVRSFRLRPEQLPGHSEVSSSAKPTKTVMDFINDMFDGEVEAHYFSLETHLNLAVGYIANLTMYRGGDNALGELDAAKKVEDADNLARLLALSDEELLGCYNALPEERIAAISRRFPDHIGVYEAIVAIATPGEYAVLFAALTRQARLSMQDRYALVEKLREHYGGQYAALHAN